MESKVPQRHSTVTSWTSTLYLTMPLSQVHAAIEKPDAANVHRLVSDHYHDACDHKMYTASFLSDVLQVRNTCSPSVIIACEGVVFTFTTSFHGPSLNTIHSWR